MQATVYYFLLSSSSKLVACVGLIEWKLFAFGEYHLDSKQIHLVQYGFFCYSLNDATPKDSELISCDVISTTETIAVKSM